MIASVRQVRKGDGYPWYVMTHERLAPNFMSRTTYVDPQGQRWSHVTQGGSEEETASLAAQYTRATGNPVMIYAPVQSEFTTYVTKIWNVDEVLKES